MVEFMNKRRGVIKPVLKRLSCLRIEIVACYGEYFFWLTWKLPFRTIIATAVRKTDDNAKPIYRLCTVKLWIPRLVEIRYHIVFIQLASFFVELLVSFKKVGISTKQLLYEAKASVVTNNAPITLCPYKRMFAEDPSEHQTEHPNYMLLF